MKVLRLARISGIILILLTIGEYLVGLIGSFIFIGTILMARAPQYLYSILNLLFVIPLLAYPFQIGFLYGFVVLGRRFKNKLLYSSAWVYIVLVSFLFILSLVAGMIGMLNYFGTGPPQENQGTQMNTFTSKVSDALASSWLRAFYIFFGFLVLVARIIFGVGLYSLKKKGVALAGWAGIIEVVSVVAVFLASIWNFSNGGFMMLILASVAGRFFPSVIPLTLETIMLFKISKKV